MKKIRLAAAVIAALFYISITITGVYAKGIQEFTFVIISDVHVPSYGFPVGQKLDEDTLMKLHNQLRLKEFVTEDLEVVVAQ